MPSGCRLAAAIPLRPRVFRAVPLDGGYSHRLGAFGSLGDFELDSLVLLKRAKTVRLDLGVMDEDVLCTAVRGDESETFFGVEPFHSSLRHTNFPSLNVNVIDTFGANRNTSNRNCYWRRISLIYLGFRHLRLSLKFIQPVVRHLSCGAAHPCGH